MPEEHKNQVRFLDLPPFEDSDRNRVAAPNRSCSIKAVHFLGKDETLDRYQSGAPQQYVFGETNIISRYEREVRGLIPLGRTKNS